MMGVEVEVEVVVTVVAWERVGRCVLALVGQSPRTHAMLSPLPNANITLLRYSLG